MEGEEQKLLKGLGHKRLMPIRVSSKSERPTWCNEVRVPSLWLW